MQVQHQYAISLTVPLSLLATSSEDADDKAAALTTGTNATDALATALTAGLVSGVVHTTIAFINAVLCSFLVTQIQQ